MQQYSADQEEINLMAYLEIIWKRKWLIVLPAFFLAVAVGVISFRIPPKWEVDAIIQPSKFLTQTEQGQFEEIVVIEPRQLVGQINGESYNRLIASELGIDIREFPGIKAENLRDTKLIRVFTRVRDVDTGINILHHLFTHLKKEMDRKVNVEIAGVDTEISLVENAILTQEVGIREHENQIARLKLQITDKENDIRIKENEIRKRNNDVKLNELEVESREIDKEMTRKEIEAVGNKLKISEERTAGIHEEMKTVKKRMDDIDEQMRKTISERKQGTDALSLLLYSNEVQQNLRYYNTLDEKLSLERIAQENMRLDIRNLGEKINQIDNTIRQTVTLRDSIMAEIENIRTAITVIRTEIEKINNQILTVRNEIEKINNDIAKRRSEIRSFENKKGRIDFAQFVKNPTSSLNPVSPRKAVNVAIAWMAGLFMFTMLAFFIEYIRKRESEAEDKAA